MAPEFSKVGCTTLSSQIISSVDTPLSPDLQGSVREPTCSKPNQPSRREGSHGVANRARAIRHEGANLLEEH